MQQYYRVGQCIFIYRQKYERNGLCYKLVTFRDVVIDFVSFCSTEKISGDKIFNKSSLSIVQSHCTACTVWSITHYTTTPEKQTQLWIQLQPESTAYHSRQYLKTHVRYLRSSYMLILLSWFYYGFTFAFGFLCFLMNSLQDKSIYKYSIGYI